MTTIQLFNTISEGGIIGEHGVFASFSNRIPLPEPSAYAPKAIRLVDPGVVAGRGRAG